jgi:hypothetical protein
VGQQRFSEDGEPVGRHASRADLVRDWLSLALVALAIVGGFVGFQMILASLEAPTPTASALPPMSAPGSSASPSAATFPPQLIEAAIAISTSLAPTPEPSPTPRPTAVMTPAAVAMVCGEGLAPGTICLMPTLSPPSPTPLPVCPTTPGSECEWRGSISATPVGAGGAGRGP